MKHTVWKAYWDYEKEEKWLNEMSARGMALSDYTWCRYVFEETPFNQYTYRIELLKNLPGHPESQTYLRFLEENGVECVASYMRWVYLRKKTSEGPFEIYTDIDSNIKHYQRIYALMSAFMFLELSAGIFNLTMGLINMNIDGGRSFADFSWVNITLGSGLLLLGFLFLRLGIPIRRKIKKLKQEKQIRE